MIGIHAHTLVLPQYWVTGLETEDLNNLAAHVSIEFYIPEIQEKNLHVMAVENITAGVLGPLSVWVELSPVPSVMSTAYWAAIGGGGGALGPVAPLVIAGVGVGTVHTEMIPWAIHSEWARVIAQMPASANPLTAFWQVQLIFSGKTF